MDKYIRAIWHDSDDTATVLYYHYHSFESLQDEDNDQAALIPHQQQVRHQASPPGHVTPSYFNVSACSIERLGVACVYVHMVYTVEPLYYGYRKDSLIKGSVLISGVVLYISLCSWGHA